MNAFFPFLLSDLFIFPPLLSREFTLRLVSFTISVLYSSFCLRFVPSNLLLVAKYIIIQLFYISVYFFYLGEDEMEISPYDDTLMDNRMASLVAGKNTHKYIWVKLQGFFSSIFLFFLLSYQIFTPMIPLCSLNRSTKIKEKL